tara:strand:+ start:200 stop:871 length:672 start_codon:yes stop_codon:yes gene_type:complete
VLVFWALSASANTQIISQDLNFGQKVSFVNTGEESSRKIHYKLFNPELGNLDRVDISIEWNMSLAGTEPNNFNHILTPPYIIPVAYTSTINIEQTFSGSGFVFPVPVKTVFQPTPNLGSTKQIVGGLSGRLNYSFTVDTDRNSGEASLEYVGVTSSPWFTIEPPSLAKGLRSDFIGSVLDFSESSVLMDVNLAIVTEGLLNENFLTGQLNYSGKISIDYIYTE